MIFKIQNLDINTYKMKKYLWKKNINKKMKN